MILSIFDEDLKLAGVIDDYESFFAVLVHGDTSHARLTIRADKNNVDTLKRGNFIRKSDDMRLFYIADVATSYDDNGAAVSVTEYDVFYFLDGRITSAGTGGISNSSKTAEYTIKNWIDACLVNPTDADRTVGIIEVAANQDRGTLMNTIVYHTPLGDNIRNILSVDMMGVSGVYSSGKLLIDVYEGTDRSTSNTGGNSPVIFDIAYDNILSGEETESGVNAKNYAYVFSNRSGARVMVGVGTAIGANRREVGKATTETVSDDDMEILGLAELVESERGFSVSHDALRGSFEYGVDYVLGDIVTVAGRALRLVEVAQAWEAGKAPRLDLTFGMRGKTINAKTDDNTARLDDMEIQLLGVQAGGGWFLNKTYPVGAIYISVSSTSPATLFGGTWSAFGAGRVLVGINPSDTAFDTVEETGGAKTHALTIGEMPSHTHTMAGFKWNAGGSAARLPYTLDGKDGFDELTGSRGGGSAHNNLQPYIVVYMWKRTA